ncbi:MAG: hypothetical protein CFE34_16745 [Rhodobacteraceae bacterium PARR1]|nr:MAG: hypothetical protein CFE34_16745 [Rhodobacteraceae bacterium PARR1]
MSWDLVVFAADTPMGVDDAGHARFDDDFSPSPLGTQDEVRGTLSQVFPALDWADPTWGQLEGDGFSIEVALGGAKTLAGPLPCAHAGMPPQRLCV